MRLPERISRAPETAACSISCNKSLESIPDGVTVSAIASASFHISDGRAAPGTVITAGSAGFFSAFDRLLDFGDIGGRKQIGPERLIELRHIAPNPFEGHRRMLDFFIHIVLENSPK